MQDAWRAYLELALGITEASKKKAEKVARNLVGKGGTTAAQLQALAEDLISASAKNREALTALVRTEVDRALGAVGLVKTEDVADLTARVQELERELADAHARATAAEAAAAAARSTLHATDSGQDDLRHDLAAVEALGGPLAPDLIGGAAPDAGAGAAPGAPSAPAGADPAAPATSAKQPAARKATGRKAAPEEPATASPRPGADASADAGEGRAKKAVAKKAVAKKAVAKKAVAKKARPDSPPAAHP